MAEIYPERSSLTLRQEALARVREMQRRAQPVSDIKTKIETEAIKPPAPKRPASGQRDDRPQNFSQPQRMNNAQPPNILGQLFGHRSPASARQKNAVPNGVADLLKRQGLGDRIGGLGETVQNTVSSVSQPLAELLESFGIDGEKLIVLMVMWAVFNQEKENKTLLMALGYLLL